MKEKEINIDGVIDLDSAIEWTTELLKEDPEFESFINYPEEKFEGTAHHGFGTYLRNTLKLWYDGPVVPWFNEKGIHHADDMSGIIMTSLHRKYHGRHIRLSDQIDHYRNYWEKTDPKVNQGIKE